METAEAITLEPAFDFNYSQFMALAIERPKPIVEGLFCERQNVLLMGRFGVGKTMLGTQLSLSLATGRNFLGRGINRPYKTQFVDCENDLGDIKDRLGKQASAMCLTRTETELLNQNWNYADAAHPKSPLYGTQLDDTEQKGFEGLIALVREHDPDVLIIDNLGLVTKKGDLKDPEDTKMFYANLAILREQSYALSQGAIIVMHHLTKPGDNGNGPGVSLLTAPYEFISRARGSGRLLDFAPARFAIAEETFGDERYPVVHGINRSVDPVPLIMQFNSETLSFEQNSKENLRFESIFSGRPKGREILRTLPDEFTWSEAEKLRDQEGKPFNQGTLAKTLEIAVSNGLIEHEARTKKYRKLFHPE